MSRDRWTAVDRYIDEQLIAPDAALEAALAASVAAGLPAQNVTPGQGKLLHLLARGHGARTILEIGTLGGYSTIWLARALPPGGRVITIEADPERAALAGSNIAGAGLSDRVEQRLGLALDVLPALAAEGRGPFDLVFIDADKRHNADYFAWALTLSRRGTMIIVDNVVRGGGVTDAASEDHTVQGSRRLFATIAAEPRVAATAVQTVGAKGHDGFVLALVVGDGDAVRGDG